MLFLGIFVKCLFEFFSFFEAFVDIVFQLFFGCGGDYVAVGCGVCVGVFVMLFLKYLGCFFGGITVFVREIVFDKEFVVGDGLGFSLSVWFSPGVVFCDCVVGFSVLGVLVPHPARETDMHKTVIIKVMVDPSRVFVCMVPFFLIAFRSERWI
ncbi:hypothetical protein OZX74_00060 [Bifidobacterium sp. ESL0798]|uniref:hypothetical protein n=1 Tax=Bifidobacterium sp. ESL0798 TaxID=2983235 RepID=UPI0023F7FFAE|nr:hypothetical protein [Bifidobacterium sp. ESL0798]WEV74016.1 hypothetical protein OZX74_00060 [Bifidobacterium sp. ESL0798]